MPPAPHEHSVRQSVEHRGVDQLVELAPEMCSRSDHAVQVANREHFGVWLPFGRAYVPGVTRREGEAIGIAQDRLKVPFVGEQARDGRTRSLLGQDNEMSTARAERLIHVLPV